jgi:hypothetical protein
MKFTKAINREVDIDGNTFIVSMDEAGIGFRLKGKRKTARVNWSRVLDIVEGEGEAGAAGKGFQDIGSHSAQAPEQPGEIGKDPRSLSHTATAGERVSET